MKSLFGVNVTFPDFGLTVYLPTTFPSLSFAGISFSVTGVPSTTNCAGCSSVIVIGTSLLPGLNVGVPSCVAPWIPVVSAGVPSGVTGVTVGVYFAVTGVPFLSTRLTVTPLAVPVNCGSGVNVTLPSLSTVYVPSPGTTTFPSGFAPSNVGATSSLIGTLGFPGLNVGVPSCVAPWIPVVSAGVPSGVTGVTVGEYVAVAGVPLSSFACTVTGVGVPW